MLVNFQQFIVKHGARSQLHLTNPILVPSEAVSLPRLSVIHLLNYHDDSTFVLRTNPYLANIKGSKKIPVHNVTTLSTTDETAMLLNKTVARDVQSWRRDTAKEFKLVDLLVTPNTDTQINSVVNYNLLKNLYSYKGTSTAGLSRYLNVYRTYWDTVKKAIETDPVSLQFVRLDVPTLLPSVAILDRIVTFRPPLFARVVHNAELNGFVQLYKFLDPKHRPTSTMANISDEDTTHIVIELVYKGFSTFFKLSDLLSLSQSSKLESKRKLPPKQLNRYYVTMFLKLQDKALALQNGETITDTEDFQEDPILPTQVDDTPSEEDETPTDNTTDDHLPQHGISHPHSKKKISDSGEELLVTDLSEDLNEVTELESSSDDVFTKLIGDSISQIHDQDSETPEKDDGLPKLHVNYEDTHTEEVLRTKSSSENFTNYISSAKESGVISTVEARALKKLHENRLTLKSPYNDELLDTDKVVTKEQLQISPEETSLPITNPLVEERHKTDIIGASDRKYLSTVLNKDIVACISHLEKADIVIKNYEVTTNKSSLGNYDIHKLTIKPYRGKDSTVYFRIPHINQEGEMKCSGINFRMRRVRQDLPIRKISPTRVALTTNYGKLFVFRTDRKSFDGNTQIVDYIKNDYLNGGATIRTITPGNVFDNEATLPNDYMFMGKNFKGFATDTYTLIFSLQLAKLNAKEELLLEIAKSGNIYVGYNNKTKSPIVMSTQNTITDYTTKEELGTIADIVGMDKTKIPVQFSMMKVLGDSIALGVVLSYYMGLNNLLAVTKTQYTILPPRKQHAPQPNEIIIRTIDSKLVIVADTEEKRLLFGGFAFYRDFLKTTELETLNNKSVYLDIIESRNASTIHLKEMDLLERLFLDPITVGVLESMNEPTDYLKLLLRANELLKDYKHPDLNDATHSRIRGYDRVPGLMYRVIAESVRKHKIGSTRGKVELDPYKVWNTIVQDTTVKITEESNPVTDVKEMEAATFGGVDGLEKGSTPEAMRRFHKTDKGLVSEATVDSSDVGLNFYLTPNPKMSDLRGRVSDRKTTEHDVFSTSVLLAPMTEYDDPKRIKGFKPCPSASKEAEKNFHN